MSLCSTDILAAMLACDLRGSSVEESCALRRREHVDPAASSPLPVMTDEVEAEALEDPAR